MRWLAVVLVFLWGCGPVHQPKPPHFLAAFENHFGWDAVVAISTDGQDPWNPTHQKFALVKGGGGVYVFDLVVRPPVLYVVTPFSMFAITEAHYDSDHGVTVRIP